MKPYGIAATLHDAAALAAAFGPGTTISIGAAGAGAAHILAPAALILQPAEIEAALSLRRGNYLFTFGNTATANLPAIIGPMIDTLTRASGTGFLPACLATPWSGHTTYQGHQFLNGTLQTDLKREFAIHLSGSTGIVAYPTIATGSHAIRAQLAALKEQGIQLALLDAVDDDQCSAITEALNRYPIIAGPAWVSPQTTALEPEPPTGPIAILSGALQRQTLFQVGAARAAMPVLELNFSNADHQKTAAEAVGWAQPHIGETPFIISSSVPPDKIRANTPAAETLAYIAEGLIKSGIRRLVVTGNDTASVILSHLGTTHLTAGAAFGGLCWLQTKDINILIKPGNFGGKNLFLHEFEPQSRLNESAV